MNTTHARRYLRQFDFRSLFVEELGWDNYPISLTISVDDNHYVLQGAAEKRGMVVLVAYLNGEIPPATIRNKIEQQVAQKYREHVLIFADGTRTRQTWLWVRRELGRPLARRSHDYDIQQPGDSLLQKLAAIAFSFEDEEGLTLVDVTSRVRAAFNVERATKKFYENFKKERTVFEQFVQGIPDVDTSKWYVSVMLNRLMFVYFIQRKGFLDGDPDYLRNRLRQVQQQHGDDQFHSFYRYFLLRLFHEGLGQPDHDPELERLIGKVPYLNGGIFQIHEVEQSCPNIQISDAAFERIFDFFDQYQWHLDDRPLRDDREINPDVLGYIFEKYINQKQMGAYYTKEDITEYISKNTVIPFLFDEAQKDCAIAFTGEHSLWGLAQADPDRYIYEAVRKGTALALPDEIAVGIADVSRRGAWNTPTPDEYALPTEIWRETVARRQRYEEIWLKLAEGEVSSINDFITYNLDIQQFAQDTIENSEGPELLRAFWKAINRVSVLDPTCGSGAFLFAALNILQPLYEACLERMAGFVADLGPEDHPQKYSDFKQTLAQVAQHPNQAYYVLKSIVVNNLYGVDIMTEAVEIARLRLFLKLTAQVTRVEDVEPLPDIDFNIRAGNTLVGFVSKEEVARALQVTQTGQGRLLFGEDQAALAAIEEKAGDVDRLFAHFRAMQTSGDQREFDAADFVATKQRLQARLRELEDELNHLLARQYGVQPDNTNAYQKWLASHQSFHWFTEFYGILKRGGFDVIIGNPPYLTLRALSDYSLQEFSTSSTQNLYSIVLERCQALISTSGKQGYIVPVSSVATEGYLALQKVLLRRRLFVSSYDDRPAHLFTGLDKNTLSVLLLSEAVDTASVYSTRLCRWNSNERDNLFHILKYEHTPDTILNGCLPKIGSAVEASIWRKMFNVSKQLQAFYAGKSGSITYYSRKVNAFLQILDFVPEVRDGGGQLRPPSEFKELRFGTREEAIAVFCCFNSTLFRWFMDVVSDGSHLNRREVNNFPLDPQKIVSDYPEIMALAEGLSKQLRVTSEFRVMRYKHDTLTVQCIVAKHSKAIIDKIDVVLGAYYGFTDEELDFIINYDIKYRMGDDLFSDDE